ncbi:MAG TPA: glycoside hydrolase family 5 protein, partial [Pilimelia sp.]|nr:glycoside hydrolase family 5 protein [Pilimelia sp.]
VALRASSADPTGGPAAAPAVGPTTPPAAPARTGPPPPPDGPTPVEINGQLRVCGVNLCNQDGRPIQLRGMSSHGLQWYAHCVNASSLAALADDWTADVFRIAMYVQEGGYETNPARFTDLVNQYIELATAQGLYVIVDFHTLTPGDPNYNLARARTFFQAVASRHADKNNILYEIANEPNGVPWAGIKGYAEQVIPVIRAADPDAPVIVGTRGWSSLGVSEGSDESEIIADPVDAANILYAVHFYAASHRDNHRAAVTRAAAQLPLFVTEFGTQTASGSGDNDLESSRAWLDLLDSLKISYAMWTYSDTPSSNGVFTAGTCAGTTYAGQSVLKESGRFIRARLRTPPPR